MVFIFRGGVGGWGMERGGGGGRSGGMNLNASSVNPLTLIVANSVMPFCIQAEASGWQLAARGPKLDRRFDQSFLACQMNLKI